MSATPYYVDEGGLGTFSDDLPARLYTYAVPEASGGWFRISVSARRVSDGAVRSFIVETLLKRDSGDATVEPMPALDLATVGDAVQLGDLVVSISADGDSLAVDVSGQAATEIDWSALARGCLVGHA